MDDRETAIQEATERVIADLAQQCANSLEEGESIDIRLLAAMAVMPFLRMAYRAGQKDATERACGALRDPLNGLTLASAFAAIAAVERAAEEADRAE